MDVKRSNGFISALAAFLATVLSVGCYAQCTGLVGSGHEDAKPFVWKKAAKDELLTGAIPDLATIIAGEMVTPMSVKYVGPWKRVQNELKLGNIDLLWGALRNDEREAYADFVPTPLTRVRSVVLSRHDDNWRFSKLSDLEGRAGVLNLGESYGQEFDKFASARLTVTRTAKVDQAINMLMAKHADYIVVDEAIARSKLAAMEKKGIMVSDAEVAGQDLFLLVSKKSLCNTPELRDRLNRALLAHRKTRTIDRLLGNYWGQSAP